MGGRGSGSDGGKTFNFDFDTGSGGEDKSQSLFPAYANVRIKTKTVEGAMEEFRNRYKDADHEWAYVVDQQGYVHSYTEGNRSSVRPGKIPKDSVVLHNHPSGGAFSGADLKSLAKTSAKGVVASGSKYDYVITKSNGFNPDKFLAGIKGANMSGKNYDEAVHKWLKQNQRKYGYKYHRTKNS